ncbi:MAG: hypothetical protein AVDCRST_MAG64-4110, partial [uncultured Phycisphaerae bacterium]
DENRPANAARAGRPHRGRRPGDGPPARRHHRARRRRHGQAPPADGRAGRARRGRRLALDTHPGAGRGAHARVGRGDPRRADRRAVRGLGRVEPGDRPAAARARAADGVVGRRPALHPHPPAARGRRQLVREPDRPAVPAGRRDRPFPLHNLSADGAGGDQRDRLVPPARAGAVRRPGPAGGAHPDERDRLAARRGAAGRRGRQGRPAAEPAAADGADPAAGGPRPQGRRPAARDQPAHGQGPHRAGVPALRRVQPPRADAAVRRRRRRGRGGAV